MEAPHHNLKWLDSLLIKSPDLWRNTFHDLDIVVLPGLFVD